MNLDMLEAAKTRVPCIPVLINMLSKRVRQLQAGFRPYVKPAGPEEDNLDIALREIADGALIGKLISLLTQRKRNHRSLFFNRKPCP